MTANWRTDTAAIRIIDGEVVTTVEQSFPWTKPAVTTRYERTTLAARWSRIRTSPFAGDLRAATRSAFWPSAAASGLLVGLVLIQIAHALRLPVPLVAAVFLASTAAAVIVGRWLSRAISTAVTLPDPRKETLS